ncbi:MAG: hypothetical protein EBS08_07725, partial [Cytophagia bacterium]|nr:hypothetical protein [Cytophagia bacterium]
PIFTEVRNAIRSTEFSQWMSVLTGIENLQTPDDALGSGLHQGGQGSFVDVHIDVNFDPKLKLWRRINLLIYLNRHWDEAWGGHLEIWDPKMTEVLHRVAPLHNRAIIFLTDEKSPHGYKAINVPEGESRKSFYAYYFTEVSEGFKYSDSKLDIFNIPTTMSEKATDKRGKLWNIAWTSVFPNQKPYWIVVTAASNDLLMAEAYNHILASVFILGVIILGSVFLVFMIARKLSNPLELISADILKVGQWEITARPTDQYQVLEMFNLANGIEEMKTGLLSFRKYIPGDVVRQVVHSRKTAKIFVEKKNITVFFSDLKNFTSMSESLDPDVLVSILGEHLAFCSSIIHKNKGTIDKFIGDSV